MEAEIINNKVFIDLDKENKLPKLTVFQGQVDIKRNGRLIVKNSVLEDIDTLSQEDLRYVFTYLKSYISPIVTSQYIPNRLTMEIINELAPEFKVRFKTEKTGSDKIVPISSKEFLEGEEIFDKILDGINPNWSEMQKYKYLYNQTGCMLSYDLSLLSHIEHSKFHEKYSRNIFTAISRNWGICASFAAMYDYLCYRSGSDSTVLSEEGHDYAMITSKESEDFLTDPTFDSVALKFGMKTKNFGVSKEDFIKNDHNLVESEVYDYEFDTIDAEEVKKIDESIGYLDEFGGEYTDDYISNLANNLEGNNNYEKALNFLERIKGIKSIGRPSAYDFESIINFMISKSKDKEFKESVKVYSFIYENSINLPRNIAIEVSDEKVDANKQIYVMQGDLKSFKKVNKIEAVNEYKEK